MKALWKAGPAVLALSVVGAGAVISSSKADEKASPKAIVSFWAINKEAGTVAFVVGGQADPTISKVAPDTIFGGICQDCMLSLKFKATNSAKNCEVCGCTVTNAACIVGKPVKPATWEGMLQALPRGVALRPEYNTADKPDSGVKVIMVDLKAVLLPVDGIGSQTPEQVLAALKPVGVTKVDILDGGKKLQLAFKENYTPEKAPKLEKALEKVGGKVLRPEQKTAAQ